MLSEIRDSNSHYNIGKVGCYHYTNFALNENHFCGGCRIRTCKSFPNDSLAGSSCTDWGNPPVVLSLKNSLYNRYKLNNVICMLFCSGEGIWTPDLVVMSHTSWPSAPLRNMISFHTHDYSQHSIFRLYI